MNKLIFKTEHAIDEDRHLRPGYAKLAVLAIAPSPDESQDEHVVEMAHRAATLDVAKRLDCDKHDLRVVYSELREIDTSALFVDSGRVLKGVVVVERPR